PADRYQSVEEFWDDFADAALPPTRPLPGLGVAAQEEGRRRPSSDLSVEPEEFTQAPPQPRFQPVNAPPAAEVYQSGSAARSAEVAARRPKIVVPVSAIETASRGREEFQRGPSAKDRIAALSDSDAARNGKTLDQRSGHQRRPV